MVHVGPCSLPEMNVTFQSTSSWSFPVALIFQIQERVPERASGFSMSHSCQAAELTPGQPVSLHQVPAPSCCLGLAGVGTCYDKPHTGSTGRALLLTLHIFMLQTCPLIKKWLYNMDQRFINELIGMSWRCEETVNL